MILLLDGVDEIYPDLESPFIKMLEKIKQKSSNQIYLSTRPHLKNELENKFDVCAFKFRPMVDEQRLKFIRNIFKSCNIFETSTKLIPFLQLFEESENSQNCRIDNALMIKIIAEVYGEYYFNKDSNQVNLFKVLEKIIQKHLKESSQKIFQLNLLDPESRFSRREVHEVNAIIKILGDKFGQHLKDLAIIKNWIFKERNNWSHHKIQRHGILTAESKINSKMHEIDFIHRIYAELYIIKHITTFLYDIDYRNSKEECEKVFKILQFILNSTDDFMIISKILFDYVKINKGKKIYDKMMRVVIENLHLIYDDISSSGYHESLIRFWGAILNKRQDELMEDCKKFEFKMNK